MCISPLTVIFQVDWRTKAAFEFHVCSDLNQFGTFNLFQFREEALCGSGKAQLANNLTGL